MDKCPECDQEKKDVKRRKVTDVFINNNSNYITCCGKCYTEFAQSFRNITGHDTIERPQDEQRA